MADFEPARFHSWDEFIDGLRALRGRPPRTLRQIELTSKHSGHRISKSTARNVAVDPRRATPESVLGFLAGCRVSETERSQWLRDFELLLARDRAPIDEDGRAESSPLLLVRGVDGEGHFRRRSRGQRSAVRGGDLFRGRATALHRIRTWVEQWDPPGLPLVITGQPGAGKSAVIARSILVSPPEAPRRLLLFHARSATYRTFVDAVAELLGSPAGTAFEELIDTCVQDTRSERLCVALDALDEVTAEADMRRIASALVELAALPTARVVVATRPLGTMKRHEYGSLLHTLGARGPSDDNLIDLDSADYGDRSGLLDFVGAVLTQADAPHPGPAGCAWETFRRDDLLCARLAAAIVRRSRDNFLVAALAAAPLSTDRHVLDPAAATFRDDRIPSSVGEALTKYLDTLDPATRTIARQLLTALAFARGDGIGDGLWLAFAEALFEKHSRSDLDMMRSGTASDYLIEQSYVEGGGVRTRLFHQALVDELKRVRHVGDDEARIVDRTMSGHSWRGADPYLLHYAPDHAAAANRLPALAADPEFLRHGEPQRLLAATAASDDPSLDAVTQVLQRCISRLDGLDPERRSGLLHLTGAHLGVDLAVRDPDELVLLWANRLGLPHHEIAAHPTGRVAVLGFVAARGRAAVASVGSDGSLRVWSIATGEPLQEPVLLPRVPSLLAASPTTPLVAVAVPGTSSVDVWDVDERRHVRTLHWTSGGSLTGLAMGVDPKGRAVVLAASERCLARSWIAGTGEPVDEARIADLTSLTMDEGGQAFSAVGRSDIVHGTTGSVLPEIVCTVPGLMDHQRALRCGTGARLGGRPLVIAVGEYGRVYVWDATNGERLQESAVGHRLFGVTRLWHVRIDDRDVLVGTLPDGGFAVQAIRWDGAHLEMAGGLSENAPPSTPGPFVSASDVLHGDDPVLATTGTGGTIRLWALRRLHARTESEWSGGESPRSVAHGPFGEVRALELVHVAGADLAVTLDMVGVALWDLDTGALRDRLSSGELKIDATLLATENVCGTLHVLQAEGCGPGGRLLLSTLRAPGYDAEFRDCAGPWETEPVTAVAVADVGDLAVLFVGGGAGSILLTDSWFGRLGEVALPAREAVSTLVWTNDGLLVGGEHSVWLWTPPTPFPLVSSPGRWASLHSGHHVIADLAFQRRRGSCPLVAVVDDGSDLSLIPERRSADGREYDVAVRAGRTVAASATRLFVGGTGRTVDIVDLPSGRPGPSFDFLDDVQTVRCSSALLCVATGNALSVFEDRGSPRQPRR